jgi:hypothetical protein
MALKGWDGMPTGRGILKNCNGGWKAIKQCITRINFGLKRDKEKVK